MAATCRAGSISATPRSAAIPPSSTPSTARKESLALDLKNPADLAALQKLLAKADVLIQNFRPGVIERLGLDYEAVKAINPRLVYASITGYGEEGPWVQAARARTCWRRRAPA